MEAQRKLQDSYTLQVKFVPVVGKAELVLKVELDRRQGDRDSVGLVEERDVVGLVRRLAEAPESDTRHRLQYCLEWREHWEIGNSRRVGKAGIESTGLGHRSRGWGEREGDTSCKDNCKDREGCFVDRKRTT
jgi:hypothetical protein